MTDWISTLGLVKEHMDDMTSKATVAFNTALSIIQGLQSVGQDILNIDVTTSIDDITQPSISVVWPDAPNTPTFDVPEVPPISLDYNEDPFVNGLLDELQAILLSDLQNGGTGLNSTIEDDMWTRETERDLQTLNDTKDRITRDWAETGWSLPDGVLVTTLYAADTEYQNKRLDKSRAIAEETRKIAIQQTIDSKEKSNTLVKNLQDYATGKNERLLRGALGMLDKGIALYDAVVKRVLALSDVYKSQAAVYSAEVDAKATVTKAEYEIFDSQIKYVVAKSSVQLQSIGLEIEKLKAYLGINMEGMNTAATVASHLAAGAMSAVNVGANGSFSGSENHAVQESSSTDTRYNFNYNYDQGTLGTPF